MRSISLHFADLIFFQDLQCALNSFPRSDLRFYRLGQRSSPDCSALDRVRCEVLSIEFEFRLVSFGLSIRVSFERNLIESLSKKPNFCWRACWRLGFRWVFVRFRFWMVIWKFRRFRSDFSREERGKFSIWADVSFQTHATWIWKYFCSRRILIPLGVFECLILLGQWHCR